MDTLRRLPEQITIYNTVLDKVTLVVGKNHLIDAIKLVPDWWGITVAKTVSEDAKMTFYNIREAEQNPDQDNVSIAALLWRNEALKILDEIGFSYGVRSKTRAQIYERLAKSLDGETLKRKVREYLRARANWRSDLQYATNGD